MPLQENTTMQAREKILLIVFAIASLGNLMSSLLPIPFLNELTKPFLLLSLSAAWYESSNFLSTRFSRIIAGAFFFSWIGDLMLMLVASSWSNHAPFFILGLGSFLIAHLFFIWAFWLWKGNRQGLLQQKIWLLLPFLLYWSLLLNILWAGLGDLLIPVLAYSLVLICMTANAHNLGKMLPKPYFSYLSVGTILFVLSDSLIATNKFSGTALPLASFWIMLTYIVAQYLIYLGAKGMTRN